MVSSEQLNDEMNMQLGFQVANYSLSNAEQNEVLYVPQKRDFFIIYWVKKGHGHYYIDFNKYNLKSDTLILISKDQIHHFDQEVTRAELIELSFTEDFISRSSDDIHQMLSFCIREHFEGKQILSLEQNEAPYLDTIVEQIQYIYSDWEGKEQTESLFHFMQLFLLYCHKLQSKQGKYRESNISVEDAQVISQFTNLLEINFKSTQKVNDYCDQLHLTYNTLAKHTKSYCGKTPKEIIAERVTLEAKRMLSGSDMPVKEIAYELGFDEPTNLVKYFKKNAGFTPATFREIATAI